MVGGGEGGTPPLSFILQNCVDYNQLYQSPYSLRINFEPRPENKEHDHLRLERC